VWGTIRDLRRQTAFDCCSLTARAFLPSEAPSTDLSTEHPLKKVLGRSPEKVANHANDGGYSVPELCVKVRRRK
jgi:hypothetical protein